MFEKFKEKFKIFIDRYVRFVQRILVTILLTLIYVIGFGITALVVLIFRPGLIRQDKSEVSSYWHDAKEYDRLEGSKRQS